MVYKQKGDTMENKRRKRLSRRTIKFITELMLILIDFLPIIIIAIITACHNGDVLKTLHDEFIVGGNLVWLGCTYSWITLANTLIKGPKTYGKGEYIINIIMNILAILAGIMVYCYTRNIRYYNFVDAGDYIFVYLVYFQMLLQYVIEKVFVYIRAKNSDKYRKKEDKTNDKK